MSKGDRSRRKLDFYAAIGTRELLIVDRAPWSLELYAPRDGRLVPTGVSRPGAPSLLVSEILPLTFQLVEAGPSPRVEVGHPETGRSWLI